MTLFIHVLVRQFAALDTDLSLHMLYELFAAGSVNLDGII